MNTKAIVSQIQAYEARDKQSLDAKRRVLSMLQQNTELFNRKNYLGHLTCSAWILNESEDHTLLHYHKKLNRWLQLGGHCEAIDKNLIAAAEREALEESGLRVLTPLSQNIFDIDIHLIPSTESESAHFHYDFRFVFKANERQPFTSHQRVAKLEWVKLKDLERTTTEPSLLRLRDKWLEFSKMGRF